MSFLKRLFTVLLLLSVLNVRSQDVIHLDSLQLALKNATHDTTRIITLLEISYLYNNTDFSKALEYSRQAKELAVAKKYEKLDARANVAIANTALYQGNYKNASSYYFLALKYYEDVNDLSGIMSVHNNLGATYDRLNEFDKALAHYFKAQEALNQQPPSQRRKVLLPTLYNNIGNVYQSKGDPQSALSYYEKGLALALEIPLQRVRGQLYNNIGKLYLLDLKKPEKSLQYLEEGLKVREEIGDQSEIGRSLVILSDYYLKQGDKKKAKESATRALDLGIKVGSLDLQKLAYEGLTKIEEQSNNYDEALAMHKLFKKLNDSIQNQLANSEITKLQLQYDFEKAEKNREQEEQQTRFRYLITIVVLSLLLIVAVLITLFLRARSRQVELERKSLVQDVEIKNKELTTNVMYLVRKNELINNVAERMLKLEKNALPENQKVIHEIILDLQREADNDSWKEFELRFNQVHSEFYSNLRKLYPGLSPAEEKLCAFLRLNMSSKEIAAITQQSIKSVEVARARLRKKLNLTNTSSNLVTYLANL